MAMKTGAKVVVRATGLTSMALGVVLSPIPLADEIMLVPIYGGMATAIGVVHGVAPWALPWRKVGRAVVGGLVVRAAANIGFAFVPGVAAVANAISAAVLTEVLGRYIDGLCREAATAAPTATATAAA